MIQGSRRRSKGATSVERGRMDSENGQAVSYLVRGEVAFLLFTGVCVALHPGFVLKWNEGGMSDYGVHLKTVVPYTLALAALVLFSQRAASTYASGDRMTRRLSVFLRLYSAVVLSVMLSTYVYSLNIVLKDIHFVFGTALVVVVGVASLWIYQLWPRTPWDRMLIVVQLFGDALALLTVVGALHFLFAAEILSNVGFAGLLIRTGRRVAMGDRQSVTS
jgi:hypothetical protein